MIQSLFGKEEAPPDNNNPEATTDLETASGVIETQAPSDNSEGQVPDGPGFDLAGDSILDLEPTAQPTSSILSELEKKMAKIEEEIRSERLRDGFLHFEKTTDHQPASSDAAPQSINTPILNALDKAAVSGATNLVSTEESGATIAPAVEIAAEPAKVSDLRSEPPTVSTDASKTPSIAAVAEESGSTSDLNSTLSAEAEYRRDSKIEVIRQSGLAWTAATVLFGSIVFLLVIGWIVDLVVGTTPWGAVGGIIIGSVLGFYQFFKLTSQILKDK